MGKYTYLSNDSSYSVSPEDEVEISYLDDNSLDKNHQESSKLEEYSQSSSTSGIVQGELSAAPSLSFEAQVDYLNLWRLDFLFQVAVVVHASNSTLYVTIKMSY